MTPPMTSDPREVAETLGMGASAEPTGLSSTTEPAGGPGPSGFDPSRIAAKRPYAVFDYQRPHDEDWGESEEAQTCYMVSTLSIPQHPVALCGPDKAFADALCGLLNGPAEQPLRLCGYCQTWNRKPCGQGCCLSVKDPTWEQHSRDSGEAATARAEGIAQQPHSEPKGERE